MSTKSNKITKLLSSTDKGYTAFEGIVAILIIAVLGLAGAFTLRKIDNNKADIRYQNNIESLYYSLEYFHETNGHYPDRLETSIFPWMNPENLKRDGVQISPDNQDFKYLTSNCSESKCGSYEISIKLKSGTIITKKSKK
jgi:hypothetical protein